MECRRYGVVRVTNAVLPIMRAQRNGRTLNVGSGLGFIPAPYSAYYSATKHALEGYSESLDHEVREFGVRVAVIEPAATQTSLNPVLLPPISPSRPTTRAEGSILPRLSVRCLWQIRRRVSPKPSCWRRR